MCGGGGGVCGGGLGGNVMENGGWVMCARACARQRPLKAALVYAGSEGERVFVPPTELS